MDLLPELRSHAGPLRVVTRLSAHSGAAIRALPSALGAEDLARLASLSYSHPNGFDKLVLFCASGYKLALHAWNVTHVCPAEEGGDIHDHRWAFASAVLSGTMRVEHW